LRAWLAATLGAVGGLGLLVIAFLDSSVLPLPIINDLMVINLSASNPARMPYYALMATAGSVLGCVMLFFIARKGGEAYFGKYAGPKSDRIRSWVQNNEFLTVLVGALLSLRSFILALTIARAARYFGLGYLAIRYGDQAAEYVQQHKLAMSLVTLGAVLVSYLVVRFAFRPRNTAT
jgi:membrane protein YqaA with SNARE-associated domain